MPTRADIIVRPELGKYLLGAKLKLQEQYFNESGGKSLSDAGIAELAGMVPESFRRLLTGQSERITITNAMRLIQIFRDPKIADFFDFPEDVKKSRRGPERKTGTIIDRESLVIAAMVPLLSDKQKEFATRSILFFLSNPQSDEDDLLRPADC